MPDILIGLDGWDMVLAVLLIAAQAAIIADAVRVWREGEPAPVPVEKD
jgi:hypothetical protein